MIVHLNVFGPSMKDWVSSQVNDVDVVAIEENRIRDGNAQILQDYF